jgi:hypothetical protein
MQPTRRWRRTGALAASGILVAGLATLPGTAQAAVTCEVDFSAGEWGDGAGGFTANLTITNTGDPISGWELEFDLPGSGQLVQGWSANWSPDGQTLTATNLDWNQNLGTGGTTTIGFNGTAYGGDPDTFFLNGVSCGGEPPANESPAVEITQPTDGQEFAAPADVTVIADASDPDGAIDRVEFYLDGALVSADNSAPYETTLTDLTADSYAISAVAIDNADPPATATDEIGITVTEPAGAAIEASVMQLTVPEDGDLSFTLVLTQPPAADLTVDLAASGDPTVGVAPAQLTFTTANWDEPQQATVSAAAGSGGDSATVTASAAGYESATVDVTVAAAPDDEFIGHFLEQYGKIKDPASGYFSPEWGVPYHAVETLIVEAPEHGHQTTSEAFSYWIWLEANYGRVTGDWAPFNQAWEAMETWIIPTNDLQPTNANYNPNDPATFAPELDSPGDYPSPLDFGVPVGQDPIASELASAYGSPDVYAMHWLLDVDDVHGYGRCGDGEPGPALVNTFQRGPQESVWQTIVHPSCERFNWGGPNGFLDLFIGDQSYAQQWRYTAAPDADARAVQAAYWALTWASEQGNEAEITDTLGKAAKMGDWARYSFFDKYFKQIGDCVGPTTCPGATGKDSSHYLFQWYFSWGGGLTSNWAFRIGASHVHQGYQNPMAAWALAGNVDPLTPLSDSGAEDWALSLDRQLEFYQWLQAGDPANGGLIAGGATNSWQGRYAEPPAGTPTFYGMFYDEKPVWHDPNSNVWFGFQTWSLQRVAEYLYVTGDQRALDIVDPWVDRAIAETDLAPGAWSIPSEMSWDGAPDTWDPANPGDNAGLSVEVVSTGQDVGVAAALARTLLYYAAATGDQEAHDTGLGLLETLLQHTDSLGIAVPETRDDYERFDDPFDESGIPITGVFVPDGWSGVMPNGDVIEPGVTFLDIHSYVEDDPAWPQVQAYLDGGPEPEFTYHRFWAQADIANAFADYAFLFGS